MARTIGPHVPPDLPLGDFVSKCDYCKVPNYRSRLRRDGSGKLTCEYCGDGPDATTQLEGNAEKALRWQGRVADAAEAVYDGAPFTFAPPEPPEE